MHFAKSNVFFAERSIIFLRMLNSTRANRSTALLRHFEVNHSPFSIKCKIKIQ